MTARVTIRLAAGRRCGRWATSRSRGLSPAARAITEATCSGRAGSSTTATRDQPSPPRSRVARTCSQVPPDSRSRPCAGGAGHGPRRPAGLGGRPLAQPVTRVDGEWRIARTTCEGTFLAPYQTGWPVPRRHPD